jgi:hypothetical protein
MQYTQPADHQYKEIVQAATRALGKIMVSEQAVDHHVGITEAYAAVLQMLHRSDLCRQLSNSLPRTRCWQTFGALVNHLRYTHHQSLMDTLLAFSHASHTSLPVLAA